ncbi:hypothetical protein K7X08_020019 [Anisodus acutangulus]|uniref:Uncharacterized protein n=1 Tax=Anisodus acutangulus TaxID=402998 RepID=A0A9Q1RR69_9SOLA|nr:hypothetical protein K7X08_020019 [Anisodus acutangulus]
MQQEREKELSTLVNTPRELVVVVVYFDLDWNLNSQPSKIQGHMEEAMHKVEAVCTVQLKLKPVAPPVNAGWWILGIGYSYNCLAIMGSGWSMTFAKLIHAAFATIHRIKIDDS